MKHGNFLFVFLFFTQMFAQITDENNILTENFVQQWNKILTETQEDFSLKISISIKNNKINENEISDSSSFPEIMINYNDETGFEIYQQNFSGESSFVIPSSFFNDIIPEVNALFKNGKEDEAIEYIILNLREILYSQRQISELNEIVEEKDTLTSVNTQNKTPYWGGITLLVVIFLLVIFKKKKYTQTKNSSNFFKGMSKNGFFGGGFDEI